VKKLFGLMIASACLLVPAIAQAQNGVISATATAGTGGATHVCINADANVKGMAGLDLIIHFPTGATLVGTGDAAFTKGTFATAGFTAVNTNDPSQVHVAVVGQAGVNGPTDIGCIDVTTAAGFAGGDITLEATANDENSAVIPTSVQGVTLQGTGGTTGTTTGATTTGATTTGETTTGATTTGATTGGTSGCTDVANASGDIDVTDITGQAGQAVTVEITTTKTGVAGADLTLKFDPAVLQFTGVDADIKAGSAFTGSSFVAANTNNKATGEIHLAIVASAGTTAGGVLATIPLTIVANAATTKSSLNLDATLNNEASDVITATVGNGVLQVGDCAGGTTGTTTGATTTGETTTGSTTTGATTTGATTTGETTTGTTTGTTVPNDVNGDGKTDVNDVRQAIKVLFGVDTDAFHKTAADFDKNGTIDLVDIRRLLQLIVNGG
jgi:hypothetical protein